MNIINALTSLTEIDIILCLHNNSATYLELISIIESYKYSQIFNKIQKILTRSKTVRCHLFYAQIYVKIYDPIDLFVQEFIRHVLQLHSLKIQTQTYKTFFGAYICQ